MTFPSPFSSLPAACRAAILHLNELRHIDPRKWAETYHTDEDTVRETWLAVDAELRAKVPPNSDIIVEGK